MKYLDRFIGACFGAGLAFGAMVLLLPAPTQPTETLDPALTHMEQLVHEQRTLIQALGQQLDWLEQVEQVSHDCSGYVEAARDAMMEGE